MFQDRRVIVAVAVRFRDLVMSMQMPARHHDLLWAVAAAGINPHDCDQGFLDRRGVYLSRMTARTLAIAHGQVKEDDLPSGAELFSEDLW